MAPERLSNLFKVTQLVRSMVKLSIPKPIIFSLMWPLRVIFSCSFVGVRGRDVGDGGGRRITPSLIVVLQQSQRESEQVLGELTSKATSPGEPGASGPLLLVACISSAIIPSSSYNSLRSSSRDH